MTDPELDAVLDRAGRVGVVALSDHAQGPDGIVALAAPAVVAARPAGPQHVVVGSPPDIARS